MNHTLIAVLGFDIDLSTYTESFSLFQVKRRLAEFTSYSEELADYYEDAQHVNADQDPHTVFECLESMIVNPLPKRL